MNCIFFQISSHGLGILPFAISLFFTISILYMLSSAGKHLINAGNEIGNKNIKHAGENIKNVVGFTFVFIILGIIISIISFTTINKSIEVNEYYYEDVEETVEEVIGDW